MPSEPKKRALWARRWRRLRALALLAAALAAYGGWRKWQRRSWQDALAVSLPGRLAERRADYADFLVRCETALLESGLAKSPPPALPQTLDELRAEGPGAESLAGRFEEVRRALIKAASQPIFERAAGGRPFASRLLEAPTYLLTQYDDSFHGQGGWVFLRHLPDLRGATLLYFPAAGYREAAVLGGAPLGRWLKTYDRVVALDVAPPSDEGLCALSPPAWQSARQALALLAQIESEAGGPTRFLALVSEGQEAALVAALLEPRVELLTLSGPATEPERQERLAFLLAMLGDRQIVVRGGALEGHALESLRAGLHLMGREAALRVE